MTYQITLNLSDEEYAAVSDASQASGRPMEELVREAVAQRFPAPLEPPKQPVSEREVEEYFYRIGFTSNLPTHELDTPAEAERLAELFAQGKSLSEMIIEDRGPC
jgi:hypothetical protein